MNAFNPILTVQQLAQALGGQVVAPDQVLAPGPGHSPEDRSLSVWLDPADPAGFRVHSHAGDDTMACRDYVRHRLGLEPFIPHPTKAAKPTLRRVAEYVYRREDGTPYLKVTRWQEGEKKSFSQSRWTGSSWVSGKPKGPKLPYRLPELLADRDAPIFVCEGEKDADRVAGLGLIGTSASEGAGSWTADLGHWFQGRVVYVLADNDPAGKKHAQEVGRHLHGVAREVRVVHLPGLPDKGDVSDWIEAGGTADALVELAPRAAVWMPGGAVQNLQVLPAMPQGITAAALKSKTFKPVAWVIPGLIPDGLTMLAGKPKLGKSWLMLHAAAAVARGGFVLDQKCAQGDVLYAALEDNQRRLRDRMAKVCPIGEWPERLTFWTDMQPLEEGGLDQLRAWAGTVESPRLIVIDVFSRVRRPQGAKESIYHADYLATAPLKRFADETGIAVVIVHHLRKMASDADPLDMVSGSTGLTGAMDTVLVLNRGSDGVTLYARGRDIEETEKAVEFDKRACKWSLLGDASEVRVSVERRAIIEALRSEGEPMKPAAISDVTGQVRGNTRRLLLSMARDGEVTKLERGKYVLPDITPPNIGNKGT